MKHLLRSRVALCSSFIEIALSVLILIGVVIVSISLVRDIGYMVDLIYNSNIIVTYETFLSNALLLIIGVEFVKMLSKHTLGSTIEVLLFAIARKIIVGNTHTGIDLLLGVIAIALLFAVKKYLFTKDLKEGMVLGGAIEVKQANMIADVNIPTELGNTLGGVVSSILKEEDKNIMPGRTVQAGDALLRITNVRDGLIDKVEIIKNEKRNKFFNIFN